MKANQQTLKVAENSQVFLEKITQMREAIRPLALRDINAIKKLTGMKDLSYEDITFMKRAVREIVLSRDPNNIQVLKCFSLENTLQGLCLLLKKHLHAAIKETDDTIGITTLVLDQTSGEVVDEIEDIFDFGSIEKENMVTLFKLDLKDRGTIVLDLFTRDGQAGMDTSQASTLTERGSSKLTGQTGVAYVHMRLPREQY